MSFGFPADGGGMHVTGNFEPVGAIFARPDPDCRFRTGLHGRVVDELEVL